MQLSKTLILFLLNCLPIAILANGYLVSGTVVDIETKKPVYGATVFINNSTKGSFTDSAGNFIINNVEESYFDLVVLKQGFERVVYRFMPEQKNRRIRFEINADTAKAKPEIHTAAEVNAWLNVFSKSFLDNADNVYECYIANSKALRFSYDEIHKQLFVSAVEPLQIFNESLGYMVICELDEYVVNPYTGSTNYNGYFWFKELSTKKKELVDKWKLNRLYTYKGSLLHFMQALYADELAGEGFVVRSVDKIYQDKEPLDFNYAVKKFKAEILEEQAVSGVNAANRKYVNVISDVPVNKIRVVDSVNDVIYLSTALKLIVSNNKLNTLFKEQTGYVPSELLVSSISLNNTASLRIEGNGSFFESYNLMKEGYWAKLGMAALLPSDYNSLAKD